VSSHTAHINLEDAKKLVALLEADEVEEANALIESSAASEVLFEEVGKLTRQLHDSLKDFHLDSRISNLAKEDIPDAKNRLAYVMEKTEQAANKTMDAVEASLPIATQLSENIKAVIPTWDKLMTRQIDISEFKRLCHSIDDILRQAEGDSELLKNQLNDVLMAQDFQDLTGQVIRRVIDLVREVEDNLIHLLTVFGGEEEVEEQILDNSENNISEPALDEAAEGPIVDAERSDVVAGQDDVDDLLSSLGF